MNRGSSYKSDSGNDMARNLKNFTHDLFHEMVYRNVDFTIEKDSEHWDFPQYYVYDSKTGELIGTTNADYFMGVCRIIINEYKKRTRIEQEYGTKDTACL